MLKLPKPSLWVVSTATALFVAATAEAAVISVQVDYDLFGHLENNGPRCAATATINSFQYLKNRFGDRAGNIIPGAGTDLESARDMLADG